MDPCLVTADTPYGFALCGPGGAGWTGLVYGETQDAHWRWYTDGDGRVDIPVLDLKLTVPA